jgi:NAD+ synthase
MHDIQAGIQSRISFIQNILAETKSSGIIFANSGGKDCVLTGILCKMACDNTISVCMPCGIKRSYNEDLQDALLIAEKYSISNIIVDLASVEAAHISAITSSTTITDTARINIAPRLRMTTLYAISNSHNLLVAGTSNLSEYYLGYYTKWGDGAYDFNPIADLTATQVYEYLRFLDVPPQIMDKAPSGGLYEGQTDEAQLGITYAKIDNYILNNEATPEDKRLIDAYHINSMHKRNPPPRYRQ